MIRRLVILRRKPTLSVAEFRHYWENVHGPLIARLPGLRRYVQYQVESELAPGSGAACIDGIAELWFDSAEAQRAAYESPEYAAVLADEPRLFADGAHYVHPVMVQRIVELVKEQMLLDARPT